MGRCGSTSILRLLTLVLEKTNVPDSLYGVFPDSLVNERAVCAECSVRGARKVRQLRWNSTNR